MSTWRSWWRWWLASSLPTRHPRLVEQQETADAEDMAPDQAAALLRHPAASHMANTTALAVAARRLQQQLGNRGVQLLLEDTGTPLPSGLRTVMSSQLGDDLHDVRVHTGPAGAAIARAANARAVTVGQNVAFGDSAYAPDTPAGRQLLAHELAHTVQAGEGAAHSPAALEAEARTGQHPTPGSAGFAQALREEKKSWSERVNAARAATDATVRRTALITLVQEALTGYTVHIVAESPASGPVSPEQYQPAPAINFDCHLENKEYWSGAGRKGKLGPRTGYFFSTQGKGYAIIGPSAIETSTPVFTRMHADHELFHTVHHLTPDTSFNDQELAAWTNAFTTYFHEVHTARKSWQPLIDYYEGASTAARKAALDALVAYYHKQPDDIRKAMLAWLERRKKDMADKQLVKDLVGKLPAPKAPMTKPAAPPPP